jgi:hypothetical protein
MAAPPCSIMAPAPAGSERFFFFPLLDQAVLAPLEVQTSQGSGFRNRVDRQVEHGLRIAPIRT